MTHPPPGHPGYLPLLVGVAHEHRPHPPLSERELEGFEREHGLRCPPTVACSCRTWDTTVR